MLLRQGIKAALPKHRNKHREAAKMSKETGPNERTEQNSRKKLNEMEISNLSDADFKNTGYKDARGTHWVLQ